MTKSKAIYKEEKTIENFYLSDYNQLLEVMQNMMQHCSSYRSEIFNQSALLSTIARRKAYFDHLRNKAAEARKSGDFNTLKYVLNCANNSIDNKVCDLVWTQAAKMYDNFVMLTAQETSNDEGAVSMYKTSDEILADAVAYYAKDQQAKNEELIKMADFMFSSTF